MRSMSTCSCTNLPPELLKADASLGRNLSGADRPCQQQEGGENVKSHGRLMEETFKLDGRMLGSGDSVPVLMHVTYLAHLLTVCSLASQTLSTSGGSGSRDFAS